MRVSEERTEGRPPRASRAGFDMSTPLTKRLPVWLSLRDENDPELNENYRRSVRYYKKLYQARPEWCADDPRFKEIYDEAVRLRSLGFKVHVDHIVPICSELVCGLHVPWNLQIISEVENLRKSNKWWPDGPFEQPPLIELHQSRPYQGVLL